MYTIIAPVPEKVTRVITPLRQKYDPAAKVIPPHITVIEPFYYAHSLEELYDHLDEVGEIHAPIKVSLVGWDICEETRQLRLPLIAGQSEFTTLRRNLLTGPLSPMAGTDRDYWPQIVFGQFSDPAALAEAKEALARFKPQFVFRVTYLELLQRDDVDHPWRIQKRFGLEATLSSRSRRNHPVRANLD